MNQNESLKEFKLKVEKDINEVIFYYENEDIKIIENPGIVKFLDSNF